MPRIDVTVNKVGNNFKNRQEKFLTILADVQLNRLAKATEIEIRRIIKELTERPGSTGKLAESFFAEKISNTEYGVGRISFLNQAVPYWRHQNYGSLAIGANWEHWLPKGQFTDGRWVEGEGGWMKPSKPIPAKNYIEKTLAKILLSARIIIKG